MSVRFPAESTLASAEVRAVPAGSEEGLLAHLGRRVRGFRNRRGMTRKMLAEEAEVSERHLAQLESGDGNISVVLLQRIATALSVSMGEIFASGSKPDNTSGVSQPAASSWRNRYSAAFAFGNRGAFLRESERLPPRKRSRVPRRSRSCGRLCAAAVFALKADEIIGKQREGDDHAALFAPTSSTHDAFPASQRRADDLEILGAIRVGADIEPLAAMLDLVTKAGARGSTRRGFAAGSARSIRRHSDEL